MEQNLEKPISLNHKRRVKRGIALLVVLSLAAWGYSSWGGKNQKDNKGGMTSPVAAAVVAVGDIRVSVDALGTVTSPNSITVKNQIGGVLTRVFFEEGQEVKAGDVLAEIDPRPYQAALGQAEGALARDQATLKDAEIELDRDHKMIESGAISQQQLDAQIAAVDQYKGTVHADEAAVKAAKVNLGYCSLTAPVSGRVGLRLVDPGNYVAAGDSTGIVTVTQTQPITVMFTVPEVQLPAILKHRKDKTSLAAVAFDRDWKAPLANGQVVALDNQIDSSTGTVKLRAAFDNKDDVLFPNQFVNVRLAVDVLKNVLSVPTAAVQRGANGAYVYLIDADHKVSVRTIVTGTMDSGRIQVNEGLVEGDKVVTDGVDKLRDGAMVTIPAEQPVPAKTEHTKKSNGAS